MYTLFISEIYLFVVTVLSALSVVASVLIMRLHFIAFPVSRVPENLRRFMYAFNSCCKTEKVSNINEPPKNEDPSNRVFDNKSNRMPDVQEIEETVFSSIRYRDQEMLSEEENRIEWRLVARLFDKIFLIIFFLVILIVTVVSFTPHVSV